MSARDEGNGRFLEPPILVFGGPYSNLRAVDALRERALKLGIVADHCICTGDVVAYCPVLARC
jgi:hypothetical protein